MFDGWLRSSLLVLVLFLSGAVLADGFVIYSSWQLEWRARTEAVRTEKTLDVSAMVKRARVSGNDWYRVVVKVDSESGERVMLDAFDNNWDVWYLSSSDSSWVSDGSPANDPLVAAESGRTSQSMVDSARDRLRADTVAPASFVAKPLFSEDGDSAAVTLAPSASASTVPTEVLEPQVEVESETAMSEPEGIIPSVVETETGSSELEEGTVSSVEEEGELPAEPEENVVASTGEQAGDSTLTVESTLREVEEIQRQAQDLISNWVQREDPTTYELPTDSNLEMRENQNLAPTRETWFNELRLPDRRRR